MGHPEARTVVVGEADATLDERLTRELDVVNRSRTPEVPEQRELTVRVLDAGGALLGGVSGWTWDEAAGIGLTWVDDSARGRGVGTEMLAAFETEAAARGVRGTGTSSSPGGRVCPGRAPTTCTCARTSERARPVVGSSPPALFSRDRFRRNFRFVSSK